MWLVGTPTRSVRSVHCGVYTRCPRATRTDHRGGSLPPDERGRAPHFDHSHLLTRVHDLSHVVRSSRPELATDLDHSPSLGHLLDDGRLFALDRIDANHRML